MVYMATAAQIQAAIADASANDLSFADMAALVKRAIINSLINSTGDVELAWAVAGSRSTSVTRMSMDQAQALLDFCLKRSGGGVIGQYVEFTKP